MAFLTRYTSTTLTEALELDSAFMVELCDAVAEIVKQENEIPAGKRV